MNIQKMMAEAQKLQQELEKKQKQINETEFIGESEWVEIILMGDYSLKKLTVKDSAIPEDKEVLEDMILIAHNEAVSNIKIKTDELMGQFKNVGGLF